MNNLTKALVASVATLLLGASAMAETANTGTGMTKGTAGNTSSEGAHSVGAGNGSENGATAQMNTGNEHSKNEHSMKKHHRPMKGSAAEAKQGAHSVGAGNGSANGAEPQTGTTTGTH